MNHREAVRRQAAERYRLDELSSAERSEFEEHFFECAECAADVEAVAAFAANARSVFSEEAGCPAPVRHRWTEWLRPVSVFALVLSLLLVIAYEEMLRVPGFKRELAVATAPQAYPAFFVRPVARGDDQVLQVPKAAPFVGLSLDVPPGNVYREYECEIREASGDARISIPLPAPVSPGSPLNVLIPMSRLRPGSHTLILRGRNSGPTAAEVSRFSFTIQLT